jgi:hypothetical protein
VPDFSAAIAIEPVGHRRTPAKHHIRT